MKLLIASLLVTTALIATPAHARKDCEELKREIAAKIDANGVKAYSLGAASRCRSPRQSGRQL